MSVRFRTFVWVGVLMFVTSLSGLAQQAKTEAEKVQALIAYVEKLDGAVFIRNGTEHDAKRAADHLRRKWDAAKDKVKTAREYVQQAASKSSASGKPYQIRFKDGTVKTSEEVLLKKLDEIEKG